MKRLMPVLKLISPFAFVGVLALVYGALEGGAFSERAYGTLLQFLLITVVGGVLVFLIKDSVQTIEEEREKREREKELLKEFYLDLVDAYNSTLRVRHGLRARALTAPPGGSKSMHWTVKSKDELDEQMQDLTDAQLKFRLMKHKLHAIDSNARDDDENDSNANVDDDDNSNANVDDENDGNANEGVLADSAKPLFKNIKDLAEALDDIIDKYEKAQWPDGNSGVPQDIPQELNDFVDSDEVLTGYFAYFDGAVKELQRLILRGKTQGPSRAATNGNNGPE